MEGRFPTILCILILSALVTSQVNAEDSCTEALAFFKACFTGCSCPEDAIGDVDEFCGDAYEDIRNSYANYCGDNPWTCDPAVDVFVNSMRDVDVIQGQEVTVTVVAHAATNVKSLWFYGDDTPDEEINRAFLHSYRETDGTTVALQDFTVKLTKIGTHQLGANARDFGYPFTGEAHQASESGLGACGLGAAIVTVHAGDAQGPVCDTTADPCCVFDAESDCTATPECSWQHVCYYPEDPYDTTHRCYWATASECLSLDECLMADRMCVSVTSPCQGGECAGCQDLVSGFRTYIDRWYTDPSDEEVVDAAYEYCITNGNVEESECEEVRALLESDPSLAFKPRDFCLARGQCDASCFGAECYAEDYETASLAEDDFHACSAAAEDLADICACFDEILLEYPDCPELAETLDHYEYMDNVHCSSGTTCEMDSPQAGDIRSDGRQYCLSDFDCAAGLCESVPSAECEPVCLCDDASSETTCYEDRCLGVCSDLCAGFEDPGCFVDGDCDTTAECESRECTCDYTVSPDKEACECDPLTGSVTCAGQKGVCVVSTSSLEVLGAVFVDNAKAVSYSLSAQPLWARYSCDSIFDSASYNLLGDSQCLAADYSLYIYLGGAASLSPSDTLTLRPNALPAEAGGYFAGSAAVAAPSSLPPPVSVVFAPESVGTCTTALVLDGSGSYDPSGRPLERFSWEVSDLTDENNSLTNLRTAHPECFEVPEGEIGCRTLEISSSLLTAGSILRFTLTVDSWAGDSDEATWDVSVVQGSVPSIAILGSSVQHFAVGAGKLLQSAVDAGVGCVASSSSSTIRYRWSFAVGSPTFYLSPELVTKKDLKISENAMGIKVGLNYTLELSAYFADSPQSSTRATVMVVPTQSPLVADIAGGSSRIHYADNPLVLSGAGSYDPDNPSAAIAYQWSCSRADGSQCFTNMSTPVSYLAEYTVPADVLSPAVYRFKLVVSDKCSAASASSYSCDTRTASTTASVEVLVGDVSEDRAPVVSVARICSASACDGSFNPTLSLRLEASWDVAPTGLPTTCVWDSDLVDLAALGIDTTSRYLVIPAESLQGGATYTFTATATRGSQSAAGGLALTANRAPYHVGTADQPLLVDPSEGVSGETSFTMQAPNWSDDGDIADLRYDFGWRKPTSGERVRAVKGSKAARSTLDYLPAGDSAANDELTVFTCVCDAADACACRDLAITVHPPTSTDLETADQQIAAALSVGDDRGILSSVLAAGSRLDTASDQSKEARVSLRESMAAGVLDAALASQSTAFNHEGIVEAVLSTVGDPTELNENSYRDVFSSLAIVTGQLQSLQGVEEVGSAFVSSVLSAFDGVLAAADSVGAAASDHSDLRTSIDQLAASLMSGRAPGEGAVLASSEGMRMATLREDPASLSSLASGGGASVAFPANFAQVWSNLTESVGCADAESAANVVLSEVDNLSLLSAAVTPAASLAGMFASPLVDVSFYTACAPEDSLRVAGEFVLSIPLNQELYEDGDDVVVEYFDPQSGTFSSEGVSIASIEDGVVHAAVPHFSEYVASVVMPTVVSSSSENAEEEDEDAGIPLMVVGAGAAVGAGLVGLVVWYRKRKSGQGILGDASLLGGSVSRSDNIELTDV